VKWPTGISILSLSLASLILVLAGFNYSSADNSQSSSVIIVDDNGEAALLDTLLPAGTVGLIDPSSEAEPPAQIPVPPAVPTPSTQQRPCININTADQAELIKLKGIGPAMSANIVDYRTKNGQFRKTEDLKNVKGIGPAKFAAIAEDICL
jgi:competence ComEA-like helix-hairpin-helix protein